MYIRRFLFVLVLFVLSASFASSATRDLAFITSEQSNGLVTVVNASNNNKIKTIPVGDFPFAIGAASDGRHVYVGNRFDGNVSVIDTATLRVVDTVFVDDQPFGVAVSPDSSLVYVITRSNTGLKVIQTSDNSVIFDMAFLANFQSIAFHPSGEFVYISDANADTLEVFRTSDNTVVASVPLSPNPRGVVVSPDGRFVYVAIGFNDEVAIVNTSSNTLVDTIDNVGDDPFCITITPDGGKLYVTNAPNSDEINVIDLNTKNVKSIAVDGNTSGVDITPDGRFAYASGGDDATVYVIDTVTDAIVDTISVPNPSSYGTFFVSIERTPIPTLSEWGLIATAGVLGIIGLLAVRRKKAAA